MNSKPHIINPDFVLKKMIEIQKRKANEMGVSLGRYQEIRKKIKKRAQGETNILMKLRDKKHNNIEIIKTSTYRGIKGGLLAIRVNEKNINITAYISEIGQKKPIILGDLDQLTFVEKKNINKKIFGYFSKI